MILLEFAAQGIRGVAPAGGRATLRPGYNVVAADGATLRRLLEALFYPDPKDADALPRASGGPANAPVRAGLTVVGNDRVTYRLVRDFTAGAQLHRFDAATRSFALVSQDLAEIAGLMQTTIGVPPPSRLGALLALSAADLPSKQAGTAALPSAAGPQRTALTPEQRRKRIDALRLEIARARIAEKLQDEQDGLQSRVFKLDELLRSGRKLADEVDQAEAALREHGPAADLLSRLGDPEARVAAYEKAAAKKQDADAKVAAEREALAAAEGGTEAPTPFWKDPRFWGGAGGGLALFALGLTGAILKSDLRYAGLLDIPAFGWGGWVALRWIAALEEKERLGRRKKIVDEWEKKVDAQWQRDSTDVLDAVEALRGAPIPGSVRAGVTKPSELGEALSRAREVADAVAAARSRLEEWEGSAAVAASRAERTKVQEALRMVEAKLSEQVGGFVRDVRSIETEIQRLEAEAATPAAPAAAPVAAPPAATPGEPLRALVQNAAAELGGSPTAAVRAVAQKASQTLAGLSFQRLQSIQADDRGNVQVQTGGRPVAALTLSPADRDLVYLSLKLAFLEQGLAAGKVIAVADDAFGGLSEGARRFAARLMKQIAKPGQLVHATTDPSFREAADHAG